MTEIITALVSAAAGAGITGCAWWHDRRRLDQHADNCIRMLFRAMAR